MGLAVNFIAGFGGASPLMLAKSQIRSKGKWASSPTARSKRRAPFVAWAATQWPGRMVDVAGWCFVAGTLIFSGSLYALALTGVRGLGAVTPVGGVLFLAGWLLLAIRAWSER